MFLYENMIPKNSQDYEKFGLAEKTFSLGVNMGGQNLNIKIRKYESGEKSGLLKVRSRRKYI